MRASLLRSVRAAIVAAPALKRAAPVVAGAAVFAAAAAAPRTTYCAEGHESVTAAGIDPAAVQASADRAAMQLSTMPVIQHPVTFAPEVPPPITRRYPAHVVVNITSETVTAPISATLRYPLWTFNGKVPGPFIRCRVGDVLEVRHHNLDGNKLAHNIDFHSVTGPGGGAPALYAEADEVKSGLFKMMYPGLYIVHCAAAPLPMHIANGMYALCLVEPEGGLPPMDREYYLMQSEYYFTEPEGDSDVVEPSYRDGLAESPSMVVFNGREGALTEKPLSAVQDERVRLYVGNIGPNLISSFHVIGAVFDAVYREGDLISPPAHGVQTTMIPAGGASVVEFNCPVPGNFTIVDHSIFRVDKGCVGFLKVAARKRAADGSAPPPDPRRDIYAPGDMPVFCPGCKLHN